MLKYFTYEINQCLDWLKTMGNGAEEVDGDGAGTGVAPGDSCSGALYCSLLYVGEIFHNTNFKNICE